jgi:hypothetical protein
MLMVAMVTGQYYDRTTPVPILKQINTHNEDGSYSYGYEAADGSYKIETKHQTGEVLGKYGYVDDSGKLREVEYGASRRGFEPAGAGINVAPPTLTNNNYNQGNSLGSDYDDGQYREDPSVYYKSSSFNSAPNRPSYQNTHQSRPSYNQQSYNYNPQPSYQGHSSPTPQHQYSPPQQQYNPPQKQYNPPQQQYNRPEQQYNRPEQQYYPKIDPNQFRGHPATNFDVYSGSYSVNYSG